MNKLVVKKQQQMPFKWLYAICRESIAHRLMRSMITAVIITLAIAFLSYIMVDSYIGSSIRDAVLKKKDRLTLGTRFISELSTTPSDYDLIRRINSSRKNKNYMSNIKNWSSLSGEQLDQFLNQVSSLNNYLDFFQSIPTGRSVILVETNQDMAIFEWLSKKENFKAFKDKLANMPSLQLPNGIDEFEKFILTWPALCETVKTIRNNYQQSITQIKKELPERNLSGTILACKSKQDLDSFFAMLDKNGFSIPSENIPYIKADIEYQENLNKALRILKSQNVRTGWFRRFQEKFSPKKALSKSDSINTYVNWIYETGDAENCKDISKEKFVETAKRYTKLHTLLKARLELTRKYGFTGMLNERAVWLIIVSFMVCAVGIANAMLMSVLERFKEIATMKCLGARNETIGLMFVVESIFVGVVGGLVGMLIGLFIGSIKQIIFYGTMVFDNFPTTPILGVLVISFSCSLLLALLAAIYPAFVASKMAPMEAMRVD